VARSFPVHGGRVRPRREGATLAQPWPASARGRRRELAAKASAHITVAGADHGGGFCRPALRRSQWELAAAAGSAVRRRDLQSVVSSFFALVVWKMEK
jgi:hypothetical protein